MPSASHRWCASCKARRIDKRAGYEMCAPCRRVHKKRLQTERQAVKARRAARMRRPNPNGVDISTRARVQMIAHATDDAELKEAATEWLGDSEPPKTEAPASEPEQEEPIIAEEPQTQTESIPAIGTPERAAYMRSFIGKPKDGREPGTPPTRDPSHKPGRRSVDLSDAQKSGIVLAYTQTDESLESIRARYGYKQTYIYTLLNSRGIIWRRGDKQTFAEWRNAHELRQANSETPKTEIVVPEPIEKTLADSAEQPRESDLPSRQLPPHIEAMRQVSLVPQAQGLAFEGDDEGDTWEVVYTGRMLVKARNAREAMDRAERDGHITTIVGVNLRSRR